MTARPNRLAWVDTGRGIAILLVALFHATNWLSDAGLKLDYWKDINAVLSSLRMPFFFVLSGLFAGKWLVGEWRALLRTKTALFAWVFVIWEIIGSVAIRVGALMQGDPPAVLATIRKLLISPVMPRFELWFIWALALFFILAKVTRRIDFRVQLLIAGAVSAGALTLWIDGTTGWTGSAKFYFFFLSGIYLRPLIIRVGSISNRPLLWSLFALWAALSVTLALLGIRGVFGLYFLNCLAGVAGGIALSRGLTRFSVLSAVGQRTLPIYLAHTPIIIATSVVISIPEILHVVAHVTVVVPVLLALLAVTIALLLHRASAGTPFRFLYEPPSIPVRRRRNPETSQFSADD